MNQEILKFWIFLSLFSSCQYGLSSLGLEMEKIKSYCGKLRERERDLVKITYCHILGRRDALAKSLMAYKCVQDSILD